MLITKLDEAISDNTILRLGEHKVDIIQPNESTDAQCSFRLVIDNIPGGTLYHVRTTDGTFYNTAEHLVDLGSEADTYGVIYFDNLSKNVYFNNKYKLTAFTWNCSYADLGDCHDLLYNVANFTLWQTYRALATITTDDFQPATNITEINCQNIRFTGNINKLKNLEYLTNLNISNSGITGNLADLPHNIVSCALTNTDITGSYSDLGNYLSLTTILLQGLTLTGTPQDAADALFNAGKTSGSVRLVAPNSIGWTLTFTNAGGTATQNQ